MASVTREPTHIMPLTLATRPTQIRALVIRAPASPKIWMPAMWATISFGLARADSGVE